VRPFGLVELQGAGEGIQDAVGDTPEVAALQAGVVLDTDPGQRRRLVRHPAGLPGVPVSTPYSGDSPACPIPGCMVIVDPRRGCLAATGSP
jgi:hypothetical protein